MLMSERPSYVPGEAAELVRQWMTDFLSKGNEQLGRLGAVCPFLKGAMDRGVVTVREYDVPPNHDALVEFLQQCKAEFLKLEDVEASSVIVLPMFTTEEDTQMIDAVHASVKISFMEEALMIGNFHPYQNLPSRNNAQFFPSRAPAPAFAIRRMIPQDHVFVRRNLAEHQIPLAAKAVLARFAEILPAAVRNEMESL